MRTENMVIAAAASGLADRIARLAEMRGSCDRRNIYYGSAVAFAGLAAIIAGVSLTAAKSESLTRAYAASAIGPDTVFTIRAHDPAGNFLVKMVRGRVVAIELEQEPVPVDRVLQSGDTVTVKGVTGGELLRIEVDPRGGLRWTARHPS